MHVLFCRPSCEQEQSDGFEYEAHAVEEFGGQALWIRAESVVVDELDSELADLPEGLGETLLRSWMVTEEEYERLYEALEERGCYLLCDPAAYAAAHYLPNSYEAIRRWAAPTRWMEGTDLGEAWALARELGSPPYHVKDHVKAAKENWGCSYVPRGASQADFEAVCERFIAHRGEAFERGLVFRAHLDLRQLGVGASGQPVFDEYRLFFLEGRLLAAAAYGEIAGRETDFGEFAELGERIDSPFFTADVARLESGSWAVIEVGDGSVSTLPPNMDARAFYRAYSERMGGRR